MIREVEAALAIPYGRRYEHVVIVPAYNETSETFDRLHASLPRDVLLVVVLNARESSTLEVFLANSVLREHIVAGPRGFETWANIMWCPRTELADVLLIDRTSATNLIPYAQGIGFIRGIGNDVAVALVNAGIVKSPYLHQADMDSRLGRERFRVTSTAQALVFSPVMCPTAPGDEELAAIFNASFRWWIQGLAYAGSPWAVHQGMPTIAVHADAYLAIGGFPLVNWAEDMSLLDAVMKLDHAVVERFPSVPVEIDARVSNRFPGSNGGQVEKLRDPKTVVTGIHPLVFEHIRALITAQRAFSRGLDSVTAACIDTRTLDFALMHFFGVARGFEHPDPGIHLRLDLPSTAAAVEFFERELKLPPITLKDALAQSWLGLQGTYQELAEQLRVLEIKNCSGPISLWGTDAGIARTIPAAPPSLPSTDPDGPGRVHADT